MDPKIKENVHFLIWYMSFFQERIFLKKFLAGDTGFWEGTRVSGRGHGFLAGDTGFWQGTRVSGMPKHIKTHIKHLETQYNNQYNNYIQQYKAQHI